MPDGEWLVADRQTAGRGRLGREWRDGAGNFMGSTTAAILPSDPAAPTLALVAGLALHETLKALAPGAGNYALKWPNDVLLDNAKLAGVLLERAGDHVVIGIGVNLVAAPDLPDRTTVALADHMPEPPQRDAFAATLAEAFAVEFARWRQFGLGPLLSRWHAAAHPVGTILRVLEPGGRQIEGTYDGLAEDGALRLRLASGAMRAIHAGDVSLGPS